MSGAEDDGSPTERSPLHFWDDIESKNTERQSPPPNSIKVPITPTTDGHRNAAYVTECAPAPRTRTGAFMPAVVLDLTEPDGVPIFVRSEVLAPIRAARPHPREEPPRFATPPPEPIRRRNTRYQPALLAFALLCLLAAAAYYQFYIG